ncbi:MAG: hypothetical protein IKP45_11020 [Bacteroidales bacterium]|nr:hypothetical protein [Bacteroidales bacterium]
MPIRRCNPRISSVNVRISVDGTYWIAGYGKYLGAHKRSPASFYVRIEVFVRVPASSVSC